MPTPVPPARVKPLMTTTVERRDPQRHTFLLRFLRRLAILFLVLSALLWAAPRVLLEFALIGPGTEEHVETARRALEAARRFGAGPDIPAFAAAERHLAEAAAFQKNGQGREARRAAEQASSQAVAAQRAALVRRTEIQEKAEGVFNDLDRQINDLEKLYGATTASLDKEQTAKLLSLMKVTRQSTGLLFLAYEKEDYDAVLQREAGAREVIASTRKTLSAPRP